LRGSSLEYKVWTIFISGKEVKDWGFMTDKGFVPHKEYPDKELVTKIFKAV